MWDCPLMRAAIGASPDLHRVRREYFVEQRLVIRLRLGEVENLHVGVRRAPLAFRQIVRQRVIVAGENEKHGAHNSKAEHVVAAGGQRGQTVVVDLLELHR